MYTGILGPLDGSAPARRVLNIAHQYCSPEPSMASSLVDGLEAEPSMTGRNRLAIRHPLYQANVQQQNLFWRLQTRS